MRPRFVIILVTLLALESVRAAESDRAERAIHEERFVSIGGVEHWVSIKGTNRNNPVLLFVHGGPGNPLSILSDALFAGWDEHFTLVHYDQRGSGKTYGRNLPVKELTLEILAENELTLDLLVADGIEVTQYLCDHLGKEKVILTGTSWGSALAVKISQATPERFHAYVGLSQMVNFRENIAASYALVRKSAEEKSDTQALEILTAIGPPPWQDPRSPGRLRRIVRQYENEVTSPGPELIWGSNYDSPEGRAAYYAGEEFSWVKFVGMKGDGFANQLDLARENLKFSIPVVLIQGEEDLLTTPDVSQEYFSRLTAPTKEWISVPEAGHDPNLVMLAAQLKVLRGLGIQD